MSKPKLEKDKDGDLVFHDQMGNKAKITDIQTYLMFALQSRKLPRVDTSDPMQIAERIDDYFQRCLDMKLKPTKTGLINSLGISTSTWANWQNGRSGSRAVQNLVASANGVLEEMWEQYMLNGKVNPVAGIFIGNNQFGYQQKTTMVVQNNPLGELPDEREIIENLPKRLRDPSKVVIDEKGEPQ